MGIVVRPTDYYGAIRRLTGVDFLLSGGVHGSRQINLFNNTVGCDYSIQGAARWGSVRSFAFKFQRSFSKFISSNFTDSTCNMLLLMVIITSTFHDTFAS